MQAEIFMEPRCWENEVSILWAIRIAGQGQGGKTKWTYILLLIPRI